MTLIYLKVFLILKKSKPTLIPFFFKTLTLNLSQKLHRTLNFSLLIPYLTLTYTNSFNFEWFRKERVSDVLLIKNLERKNQYFLPLSLLEMPSVMRRKLGIYIAQFSNFAHWPIVFKFFPFHPQAFLIS